MKVIRLEKLALIKTAVTFWKSKDLKIHTAKQINGLVMMEGALEDLKSRISQFEICFSIKIRLINMIERIGFELYVFMSRSPVNENENDLDLANDIMWSPLGLINEKITYNNYFKRNCDQIILNFQCACLTCDELEIRRTWRNLKSSEQYQLKRRQINVILSYWIHILTNNMDNFNLTYGYSIIGFDPFRSVEYNMFVYSLTLNLKPALMFFYQKLPNTDKQFLANGYDRLNEDGLLLLLKTVLKEARQEHFKFICSFLERPTVEISVFETVATELCNEAFQALMDHLLRLVNSFGDLHYDLFRRLVKMANIDVKNYLITKLDFYFLNLLARGRFETFEDLLSKDVRSILMTQVSHRLQEGTGLSLIFTICQNNHKHLLIRAFEYLSKDKNEELFLKNHLDSILNNF